MERIGAEHVARNNADRVRIEENTARCLDLRRMGLSERMVSAQAAIPLTTVHRLLSNELKRLVKQNDDKQDQQRELELQKLDALEREMQRVMSRHHCVLYLGAIVKDIDPKTGVEYRLADDGPVIAAARELRSISERRCHLLGLDMPTKTEITGAKGGPIRHDISIGDVHEYRERLAGELTAFLAGRDSALAGGSGGAGQGGLGAEGSGTSEAAAATPQAGTVPRHD